MLSLDERLAGKRLQTCIFENLESLKLFWPRASRLPPSPSW